MSAFDSIPQMVVLQRRMARTAMVCLLAGAGSWPLTLWVAIPAIVLGATALTCALFSWFWLEHLREIERQR